MSAVPDPSSGDRLTSAFESSAGVPHADKAPLRRVTKVRGTAIDSARTAAKRMRRALTPFERRLWNALKRLDLNGTHFRRQAAIGPYITDFACHAAKLAIEIDGGVHDLPGVRQRDELRDVRLTAWGYRVLRFTDKAVIDDLEGVVAYIERAVRAAAPTPGPSPQGGGENQET